MLYIVYMKNCYSIHKIVSTIVLHVVSDKCEYLINIFFIILLKSFNLTMNVKFEKFVLKIRINFNLTV